MYLIRIAIVVILFYKSGNKVNYNKNKMTKHDITPVLSDKKERSILVDISLPVCVLHKMINLIT